MWFTKNYHWLVLAFFCILGTHSIYNASMSYGDHLTGTGVLLAGENFSNHGFLEGKLTPMPTSRGSLETCRSQENIIPCLYTHYPQLPYWINGWLRNLGFESLSVYRFVALSFSFLAMLLALKAFGSLLKNETLGALVGLLWMANPMFVRYIDGVHQHPINALTLVLFILFWLKYLQSSKPIHLLGALTPFCISTWTTFEHFLFVPIVGTLSAYYFSPWRNRKWGLFLLLALPPTTLLVRMMINSWALGGWGVAVDDMLGAASHRSTISPIELIHDFQKSFFRGLSPFLPLFFISLYLKYKGEFSWDDRARKVLLIFFLAPLAWWLLMPQHSATHTYVGTHFNPLISVFGAYLSYSLWNHSSQQKWLKVAVVICLVIFTSRLSRVEMLNRFVPLDSKAHAKMKMYETERQTIKTWGSSLPQDTVLMFFGHSHWGYFTGLEFYLIDGPCDTPSPVYPHVLIDNEFEEDLGQCQAIYPEARNLGPATYFTTDGQP